MTSRLEISIGPVQSFVTQARRTRDLWSGSFLLSYLSAVAMSEALDAGATPQMPARDVLNNDSLFAAVTGRNSSPVRLGSLPNHFTVSVAGDDSGGIAVTAVDAARAKWEDLCSAVFERYLQPALDRGRDTEEIWQRQTVGFWDITWVVVAEGEDSALARRKMWRTHCLPEEAGGKCTVMHDFQELSGHLDASRRDQFWAKLREVIRTPDIREGERLCAPAFVKRMFPRVVATDETLGFRVDAESWPSTLHLAAVPWLQDAGDVDTTQAYVDKVNELLPDMARRHQRVPGVRSSPLLSIEPELIHDLRHLRPKCVAALDTEDRVALIQAYKAMVEARTDRSAPAPFFAVLAADGDRMGETVRDLGHEVVGAALGTFTSEVSGIVERHEGVTVYMGGDDLLALLPATKALPCAAAIESVYRQSFGRSGNRAPTLSASVTIAHMHSPLVSTLAESRRLLEGVAKEDNGRDSLAVGVLKQGGLHVQWVSTWRRPGGVGAVEALEDLVSSLSGVQGSRVPRRLPYKIRGLLSLLCDWSSWTPGTWSRVDVKGLDPVRLLEAEIVRSMDADNRITRSLARDIWGLLARSSNRQSPDNGQEIGADALVLADFLASGLREDSE